jgi:protein-S-isoprenylcysteine O-methyltransferase Ste14
MSTNGELPALSGRSRGEGWVVAQVVLMLAVGAVPHLVPGRLPLALGAVGRTLGGALVGIGVVTFLVSARWLGPNLTPFPRPRRSGALVTSGPYGLVRHPIYFAVVAAAFGWSLLHDDGYVVVGALALLVFFDFKSRREERWLVERYPEYRLYQERVRKLLPLVY